MIQIPAKELHTAGRLLGRLRTRNTTLPALGHILVESDPARGTRLTACGIDLWATTRLPGGHCPSPTVPMLVPPEAFDAALKADRGTTVSFAPRGARGDRHVRLTMVQGGLTVETRHPSLDASVFPACPQVPEGARPTPVPGRTFEMVAAVAGCASKDPSRHALNGVLLTPEDGGMVVATDGRRLAAAPASVPDIPMVIPASAVHLLGHRDFQAGVAQVTPFHRQEADQGGQPGQPAKPHSTPEGTSDAGYVRIEAGAHTLVARLVDGRFPSWKQVVPKGLVASASLDEGRRAAVIGWLRTLRKGGKEIPVELRPGRRGHLALAHAPGTGHASRIEVPARITGNPRPVALGAAYLADALTIAPTLWIIDEVTPVVARRLDGALCVVMPMRLPGAARAAA